MKWTPRQSNYQARWRQENEGNKKPGKNIAEEPEMKELKRMIRAGELDPDRTIDHLEESEDQEED